MKVKQKFKAKKISSPGDRTVCLNSYSNILRGNSEFVIAQFEMLLVTLRSAVL